MLGRSLAKVFLMTDIMAVASSGGHWEQMQIVSAAFDDRDVFFVTTKRELLTQAKRNGAVVRDCNRNNLLDTVRCFGQCVRLVLGRRPKTIISTGAAPGVICLALGRLVGARTIWIDSVANTEKLSMSGKMARRFANVWLTQWAHLATPAGPSYHGELL